MIHVVTFDPHHWPLFNLRPEHVRYFDRAGDPVQVLMGYVESGCAYTFLSPEGYVMAIGGIEYLWKGVGHIWLMSSTLVDERPVAFARAARRIVDHVIRAWRLRRIVAQVRADYTTGIRWMEHLGFKLEGTLRQHNVDGTDSLAFGKLITLTEDHHE